jgi:hypothetical protein
MPETVAQHLAKTGQFVSAGLSDPNDQANGVEATQSSAEAEVKIFNIPCAIANQNLSCLLYFNLASR